MWWPKKELLIIWPKNIKKCYREWFLLPIVVEPVGINLNLHISKKDTQDKKHTFCLHIALLGNINLQNWPLSIQLGPLQIFSKIHVANECLSPVSTLPLFSGVNATLAINPCHGFSVIASVVDTGDFSLVNSYFRWQWHWRKDSPANINLTTPKNDKLAKILSLDIKCTQLSSYQNMRKNYT